MTQLICRGEIRAGISNSSSHRDHRQRWTNACLRSAWLLCSYTGQEALPRAWCCLQWEDLLTSVNQLRQSLIDTPTSQPNADNPSLTFTSQSVSSLNLTIRALLHGLKIPRIYQIIMKLTIPAIFPIWIKSLWQFIIGYFPVVLWVWLVFAYPLLADISMGQEDFYSACYYLIRLSIFLY